MKSVDGGLYLVEHRLPKVTEYELALLQAALAAACSRSTARGERVGYLGSTFLPASERLLSLFAATGADAVRHVVENSQAPPVALEVAIELPLPRG
ncbi:MAG TPA: hypothetical protein VHO95_04240 [Candidatus Dormibacteraeota bacterium]|nr:hypothetical protein [Candidatus Dormibacteraeota bacterium]HEX2681645.1 hypothetical protein [Candidatus Dormibacteraeota bacterium]